MEAARELRRITIQKDSLYKAVGILCLLITAALAAWTTLDPPHKVAEYEFTKKHNTNGEFIVDSTYYCSTSDSTSWAYAAVAWNAVLLISASVLAFQTRNVIQHFNESRTLAFLIYSHFVFVMLRISTFLLSDQLDGRTLDHLRSLLYAIDQMAACIIYFLPKLFLKNAPRAASSAFDGPTNSIGSSGLNLRGSAQVDRSSPRLHSTSISESLSTHGPIRSGHTPEFRKSNDNVSPAPMESAMEADVSDHSGGVSEAPVEKEDEADPEQP